MILELEKRLFVLNQEEGEEEAGAEAGEVTETTEEAAEGEGGEETSSEE